MTDNNQQMDIAQRVAEAIQRSSEPRETAEGEFDAETCTIIGEVPVHLRHLHNLLDELLDEASDAEVLFMEAKKRCRAVRYIFFDALEHHVPADKDKYRGISLLEDWQVVGYEGDEDDEHPLAELLRGFAARA